jgi:hypothetical protein
MNVNKLSVVFSFWYAGWSSRDGTSLILSDEIGQIFIIGTGQGESQKDAKYDQVHKLLLNYHVYGAQWWCDLFDE